MRNRSKRLPVRLAAMLLVSSVLPAQSDTRSGASDAPKAQTSTGVPDLSGLWTPQFGRDQGLDSWDASDPRGKKPEELPLTPWGLAKLKAARPPFGVNQTFQDSTDPVQKYCDTPGVTRLYLYPWQFTVIQGPKIVYLLYEFSRVWRSIAIDRDHPKDPDTTWLGDSVGRYESDTLVVDTVGFNDKTWLDHVGHPHSDALHLVERFRRVNHDTLELAVTFDDPKAYTRTWSSKKLFQLSSSPMGETLCSVSEMEAFHEHVIEPTNLPSSK
jgi:hypothetical protein